MSKLASLGRVLGVGVAFAVGLIAAPREAAAWAPDLVTATFDGRDEGFQPSGPHAIGSGGASKHTFDAVTKLKKKRKARRRALASNAAVSPGPWRETWVGWRADLRPHR